MMMTVPNLSECNLFDDNSSSPTERFQDVIELGQCKIFDSPLAKDFLLTLGECNIFDNPPSDDSCTYLLLGECNIFTKEPPGLSNAENFPDCPIEYKTLDSFQHDEHSVPQLGKPVPFPEDITTLSETLIPPDSGYHSLMNASVILPARPMNHIFPPPSVACDSFSKQFAVNITSYGDADSSTVGPRVHLPLDSEPDIPTVLLAPAGTPLLASTPNVTRECHPTPRFWGPIFSHKANIISTHDDALGIDQGMGLLHVGSNPIPILIDSIPESPGEVLASKEISSLGYPKSVDEDLEDNVHHTSTASGEYIFHLIPHFLRFLCPQLQMTFAPKLT